MVFDWGALRKAHETRDADLLLSLYVDDAELRVIDSVHQPSSPLVVSGKRAITEHVVDACSRDLKDEISNEIDAGDRVSFTLKCTYPSGEIVIANQFVELRDDKIARALTVQAWDAGES